jgi:penicillin V acylase-like amidase (Ntn superfamily)
VVVEKRLFQEGGEMKTRNLIFAVALVSSLLYLAPPAVEGCSTFLLRDGTQLLYGRNFDFFMNGGYVMTNQRNVAKAALLGRSQNPARWTSRYGSVTFNQVSKEYPYGGMNEAGLVVEIMWLQEAKYPAADDRAAVQELQWVQYQLDNCASVDEVLASDSTIRIAASGQPIHFFVVDRGGNAATIEFLDGKSVVHTGADLVVSALTNDTYDKSLDYLALHEGFGGDKKIMSTYESLDRFATVAAMLEDRRAVRRGKAVRRAFDILDAVAQGKGTVWSVVYDMKRMQIRFKSVVNKDVRTIRMNEFDFDCKAPSRVLAIDSPGKGNAAARFEDYTTELNRALVKDTFAHYRENNFMLEVTDPMQEYLARYPEMLECGSGAAK